MAGSRVIIYGWQMASDADQILQLNSTTSATEIATIGMGGGGAPNNISPGQAILQSEADRGVDADTAVVPGQTGNVRLTLWYDYIDNSIDIEAI